LTILALIDLAIPANAASTEDSVRAFGTF
jgi:hypothetical protein